ncbi:AraC family transcriptional regulator [Jeotgalibaca ciconiae]|uniref:AraC family transcriptional regulator n=1 Tax=Jeotgalibaca ciconiae TaxID=2496265 RepID=A0A3Q9BJV1_9LACT|nr:AraC family transcriptional regulator [Jeotgalibaca ciconiae]AZP03578.1 AraC family transcriptional regulator [Jeotgalibaca ciconiae]
MSLFDQAKEMATITAFYALTLNHFDMNTHNHESCEIMYVKKGRCTVETNSELRILHEGEFVFLDSHASHRLFVDTKTPCSLLNLEFVLASTGTISLRELRQKSTSLRQTEKLANDILFGYDNRNLKRPLEELIHHLAKSPSQEYSSEKAFLISLLFQQCLLELGHFLYSKRQVPSSPYLNKALSYIHGHLQEDLRIPTIATHVGINKSYLHLLFSQHLNETISSYINRKRLEKAIFLLINSELSVTDIAFQVGYNSRQHFSTTFSRYFGKSPQDYKLKKYNIEHNSLNIGQYRKKSDYWEFIQMKD